MLSRRGALWTAMVMLALGVTASLMAGCRSANLTPEQVLRLIQGREGGADLGILDVRTPQEFAAGHLRGAVNLDIQAPDFESRLGTLNRGKTHVVYCRTGNRSARAIQSMERLGFRSVLHMPEGIVGWERRGFPLSRSS